MSVMPGFLRRLFAPRWQHSDPAVRRQAIARLDPADVEDRQRLEKLAADSDSEVRRAALACFDDPARLVGLLERNASRELHERLLELLIGHAGDTPLAFRLTLVERLDDPDLLEAIALQGDNQGLRLAALARLDDEQRLLKQACENGIAAVRQAAAERVTSDTALTQLTRRARRDKQVARIARLRLNRQREDAAEARQRAARREQLLSALEQHAEHAWEPLYAGRYRHLQREWDALPDVPTRSQEQRFHEAALRCRKTIADHEAQHHAIAAADQRRDDADETRRSLIEALEDTLAGLRQGEFIGEQDIASLQAQKRLLANRWQTLSDQHAPDTALSERYNAALVKYERILAAWQRSETQAATLKQALEARNVPAIRDAVDTLDWPADLPPPALLAHAQRHLHAQRGEAAGEATASAERFAQELGVLDELLDRGAFKRASRLHQSLRQRLEQLPEDARREHLPMLKRLGAQLAELRDWRGFVAGPKREQLCHAIEALADGQALSDGELDRQHRQLVKDWKNLGDAAADRELSARFRAASDRIHERLSAWREKRDAERQQNLTARQGLCEQLEALIARPDPQADPDVLRQIRDRAREQWRRFSPVPRDQAEAVGQRFSNIRHALQMLIDQRAQEIAASKRELAERAQALQHADEPAVQRAERAKALQRRWRELGRAPKGEEQALWRAFRGACDNIFAARENARDDRAQRSRERLDAMQALIERLDAWQPESNHDASVLDAAIAEAEELEPLPQGRRSDGMRRRWAGIVRTRRERLSRLAVSEAIHGWQGLRPLLDAHLQADAKALAGEPAEDVGGHDTLVADIQRAHRQRNALRRDPPEANQVADRLARLRVHLALLAGSQVSRDDEPLRLAIQVERLNEGLGREQTKAEELHGVLAEIVATGPVPPELWQREAGELDLQLSRLAELPPV